MWWVHFTRTFKYTLYLSDRFKFEITLTDHIKMVLTILILHWKHWWFNICFSFSFLLPFIIFIRHRLLYFRFHQRSPPLIRDDKSAFFPSPGFQLTCSHAHELPIFLPLYMYIYETGIIFIKLYNCCYITRDEYSTPHTVFGIPALCWVWGRSVCRNVLLS